MPRLNAVLTSACLGNRTATTNVRHNRLSNILASAVSCSSKNEFPAPVINRAVGDLSKLWSSGFYHSFFSVCPALPTNIQSCPDAAEEESDPLLSGLQGERQARPNETISLRAGLHFCSCFCRSLELDCFLLWLWKAPGAVCSSVCFWCNLIAFGVISWKCVSETITFNCLALPSLFCFLSIALSIKSFLSANQF